MSSLEELSHRHDDQAKLAESDTVARGSPILELRGLQKKYGLVEALKPATVTFLAGEIHAIVGENGAGKSTLIKMVTLAGSTPGTPPSRMPRPPLAFWSAVAPAWMERRPATSDIGASNGRPPRSSVTVS